MKIYGFSSKNDQFWAFSETNLAVFSIICSNDKSKPGNDGELCPQSSDPISILSEKRNYLIIT